tara:strand:+ start:1151 stop:1681 length:531 start_codon:yes stop_codon:yes gene_type:complete
MFSAPIPGQSLTSEPKNSPWENPPQMTTPEEAVMWHIERLGKPKKVKSVVGLLSLDLDVVTMTEGILRGAVAEGRHSVDVSLIIAPIIHEYIKGIGDAAKIDYNEGLDDGEEDIDLREVNMALREKEVEDILKNIEGGEEIDLSPLEEDVPSEEEPMMEEPEEEPKPMGLMSRRSM